MSLSQLDKESTYGIELTYAGSSSQSYAIGTELEAWEAMYYALNNQKVGGVMMQLKGKDNPMFVNISNAVKIRVRRFPPSLGAASYEILKAEDVAKMFADATE